MALKKDLVIHSSDVLQPIQQDEIISSEADNISSTKNKWASSVVVSKQPLTLLFSYFQLSYTWTFEFFFRNNAQLK